MFKAWIELKRESLSRELCCICIVLLRNISWKMLSDLVKANLAGTNAHKPESYQKSVLGESSLWINRVLVLQEHVDDQHNIHLNEFNIQHVSVAQYGCIRISLIPTLSKNSTLAYRDWSGRLDQ